MGYRSWAEGSINVYPPIPRSLISDSSFAVEGWQGCTSLTFAGFCDAGATEIAPRWSDKFKAYYIEDELKQIVEQWGEGRTFTGYIEIRGEGDGDGVGYLDLWRLYVNSRNEVKTVQAKVVWPDVEED